jgi:predicted SAM-dependent methyltransferase
MVNAPNQPTAAAIRQRLDPALQHLRLYYGSALRATGPVRRPRQIERYLNGVPPEQRRLSIGSGPDLIDGWLCTDQSPIKRETVVLDVTKRWPIPSASFRYMACEHMIEHVPYEAGLHVINEAHRVLQPDGVLRISTPNLEVIRLLPDSDDPDVKDYIRWFNQKFGSAAQRAEETSPVHALNLVMHEFGHTYLYDEDTLRRALTGAGFRQVVRCEPGESSHTELVGIDRHADAVPDAARRVEPLILEATA